MNSIKNYIIDILDVLFFVIIITIKSVFFSKALNYTDVTKHIFLPIFSSVIILAGISFLFKKKARARFLFILNIFITIFIISDITYFKYFKDLISIPVLKNGIMLGAVKSSVGNLFDFRDLLYAVDLVMIVPVIDYIKYRKSREPSTKIKLAVFSMLLVFGLSIDAYSMVSLEKEQPRLLTTMYNRVYVVKKLGIVNYHALDLFSAASVQIAKSTPVSAKTENEIKSFLQSNSEKSTNFKGYAEGKNLLMIQVEALQNFAIGSKINGVEVTPNLNKWVNKSMYFNNFYYQIAAGGTSDAEFMTNNSLYPAPSGAAYYLYCGNSFNSMPQAFKENGYTTAAMHGYRETFWNRNVMYKKMQFDNFYNENDYNLNEIVGLGLSDKEFLNQSIDKIKNLKQPYYSFMITLSSHFPYDDTKNYGSFNVGKYENTMLGNYLKAIHYTDAQLGAFLDNLESQGLLDNTVVVLYGDHYAIPKSEEESLNKFLNITNPTELSWMELQKVPMLIHFPKDANKGVNSTYTGEMDVYPTIANLFNLSAKSLLGKDILNSKDGNVIFRNGSFTDGKVFYLSQSGNYYDISSGSKISENDILKSKKDDVLNQLEYSDEIMKHDLLKKFDKESQNK
ncbi:MAG: alkaline phosphatase [Clostridiaceae bacterium]|jgi:phosphoglycerol transferase MdoB-like AlkP superfamily enzyme|nr:alkaline phosphatase [Clostridiaceae bacterium]